MRADLYAHLQALPPAFYHRRRTGDLMSRASNDIAALRMLAGFGSVMLIGTSLTFLGTLGAMWAIDPWLTLYALAPFPALVLVAKRFNHDVEVRSTAVQEQLGALSAKVQENLTGMPVVRAYTDGGRGRSPASAGSTRSTWRAASAWRAPRPCPGRCMGLISGLGALIVLWLGGKAVVDGRITLGRLRRLQRLPRLSRVADHRAGLDAGQCPARPRLDAAHRRDPRRA